MRVKTTIDIYKLIHWALVKEHVEHVAWLQSHAYAPGQTSGFATSNSVMELGTRVDSHTFAQKVAGAKCHDDALTVLDAIRSLPFEAQVVVIKCGRADCFPDYAPEGLGKMVPVLDRNGNHKKMWENPSKRSGFLGYEMIWEGLTREELNFYRSEYRLWREALIALHGSLRDQLKSYELSKRMPSATPWKHKRKADQQDGVLKKAS